MASSADDFAPALIVVDMQEDFCAPHGSLGIDGGRELAPLINSLLGLPFKLRIATADHHAPDSLTFASSHGLEPFTSTTITNPSDSSHAVITGLWPDHCVAGTPGAALIPELNSASFDFVVRKGMDRRSEMYSGFKDCFGRKSGVSRIRPVGGNGVEEENLGLDGTSDGEGEMDLAERLRGAGVRQVYCVGLAGDVCVKQTAIDAAEEGFESYWVEDGQRCVSGEREAKAREELAEKGVRVVRSDDPEMKRVWEMVKEKV